MPFAEIVLIVVVDLVVIKGIDNDKLNFHFFRDKVFNIYTGKLPYPNIGF